MTELLRKTHHRIMGSRGGTDQTLELATRAVPPCELVREQPTSACVVDPTTSILLTADLLTGESVEVVAPDAQARVMTQTHEPVTGPLEDQLAIRLQYQRIIVLGQEVDDPVANRICAQLLLLSAEDPHRDISLYINSPGGSVTAGMAIYDTMQLIPNDVSTLGMGLAASMGQFLLTAGSPGKRFVLPNAEVLLHQGSAGFGGSASDIEIQAARLARLNERMLQITAEQTGESAERIARDSLRDRWFTATEAREYGLVDAVLTEVHSVTPARRAAFGLTDATVGA
jgi:ATP-dependent Clp protease protease subunit